MNIHYNTKSIPGLIELMVYHLHDLNKVFLVEIIEIGNRQRAKLESRILFVDVRIMTQSFDMVAFETIPSSPLLPRPSLLPPRSLPLPLPLPLLPLLAPSSLPLAPPPSPLPPIHAQKGNAVVRSRTKSKQILAITFRTVFGWIWSWRRYYLRGAFCRRYYLRWACCRRYYLRWACCRRYYRPTLIWTCALGFYTEYLWHGITWNPC